MAEMEEKYSWEGIKFELTFSDLEGHPISPESVNFLFIYRDEAGQSCIISQHGDERENCIFRDGKLFGIFEPNTFRRGILIVERRFLQEDSDFEKGYCPYGKKETTNIKIV